MSRNDPQNPEPEQHMRSLIRQVKQLFAPTQREPVQQKAQAESPVKAPEPKVAKKPKIGPWEYHLRQRQFNYLFPESRQRVEPSEWGNAETYDLGRNKAFDEIFCAALSKHLVQWGSEAHQQKVKALGTFRGILGYYLQELDQLTALLEDYAFVWGTEGWVHSADDLFLQLFKLREKHQKNYWDGVLKVGDEALIASTAKYLERERTQDTWRFSHCFQLGKRKCTFCDVESDFWPRIFSERDEELVAFLSFAKEHSKDGSLRRDGQMRFMRCFSEMQKMVNALPIDKADDPWQGVQRFAKLLKGLENKGVILGIWQAGCDRFVYTSEFEELLKSAPSGGES